MSIEEIVEALKALIDAAEGEGRNLTDEEVERAAELERQLAVARRTVELRGRVDAYSAPATPALHTATAAPEDPHERAFDTLIRTGTAPPELAEYRAQSTGVLTAGGYLVPAGFRAKLIERIVSFGGIAENAEDLSTSEGNTLSYPTVNDTANIGEIVAEGGTFAAGADVVFGTRSLTAYKYMAGGAGNLPLKVSWELAQDSAFDLQSFLARILGTRIARLQAIHWATGTGTGQPQGIVTPFTTSGAIASNTTGPTYAELLATVNMLDPAYQSNAKWLMNSGSLAKIQGLTDTTGRPLLNDANAGIANAPGGSTLLGYPVVVDQAMPAMAAGAKFLFFGDIRQTYVIRRVKDVTLVVLNELYAANGQTGFMSWARADGAVQDMNAGVVRTAAA